MIKKQSNFSRSLMNEKKMGAYYTDLEHCKWIGRFLNFPQDKEVCALEPSIGDAKAILTTIGDAQKNVKIYGIEINKKTYEVTKKNTSLTVLNADFLNGVKISNHSFSYVFCNPPYVINANTENERQEKSFIEKLYPYMKNQGVLVYIIPYSVFIQENFLNAWCKRFKTVHIFQFHEKEFKKYHQVVAFGIKKNSFGINLNEINDVLKKIEHINILPINYSGEKIPIPGSNVSDITFFTTKEEDVEKSLEYLKFSGLHKFMESKISIKPFEKSLLNQPVTELKADLKYLVAISGGGQGLAGDEENGDLHLQRGTVKRVEQSQITAVGDTDIFRNTVRECSSICMTIIENNGRITRFK